MADTLESPLPQGSYFEPQPEAENPPNLPAMGSRRSRLHEGVGYHPE